MSNITADTIKEIAATMTPENELCLGEIRAICGVAQNDPFEMVCHAYAYGFHRGQGDTAVKMTYLEEKA